MMLTAIALAITPALAQECVDVDLGNTRSTGATGTTIGMVDDFTPSCAFSNNSTAEDVVVSWRAPSNGWVRANTVGSGFDTVLYVLDGCDTANELACNDDTTGLALRSQVDFPVTGGRTYLFVVDGFSSNAGDFVLNVDYCYGSDIEACESLSFVRSVLPEISPSASNPALVPLRVWQRLASANGAAAVAGCSQTGTAWAGDWTIGNGNVGSFLGETSDSLVVDGSIRVNQRRIQNGDVGPVAIVGGFFSTYQEATVELENGNVALASWLWDGEGVGVFVAQEYSECATTPDW